MTAEQPSTAYSRDYPRGSGQPDIAWPTSLSIGRWLRDVADQLAQR